MRRRTFPCTGSMLAETRVRPSSHQAQALVAYFGSPLYVDDLEEVERRYRRFAAAFPYEPTVFHYAIVCNKNHAIVRRLHDLGAGVHANTPGDAFAALAAGVPAEQIVYSGTNLTADDLQFLFERGIALNVDSLDQVRDVAGRTVRPRLGVRVLIDDGSKRNRIGLAPHEVAAGAPPPSGGRGAMYGGTHTLP